MFDRSNDLIREMTPNLESIRATQHPRKTDVDYLLCYSARHVSAVECGRELELRRLGDPEFGASVLGIDGGALEIATLDIVLGSALTALDLCASALWFWVGSERAAYSSLTDLARRLREGVPMPDRFVEWIEQTRGSHHYAPIKAFRNSQIHRMVRQDATVSGVGMGATPTATVTVGADPKRPTTRDRATLVGEVADFVPVRWKAFWTLFP